MFKKIVPSIMCGNPLELERELQEMSEAGIDWLHCDVMDGQFVANMAMAPYNLKPIIERGSFTTDIHLAVVNPEMIIPIFTALKPDYITFHIEATNTPETCISLIRNSGIGVGLAISPESDLSTIDPFLEEVDLILLMTVNPGFSGQKFNRSVLAKLKRLHEMLERCEKRPLIEVDGNIYDQTIADIIRYGGANLYVVGTTALYNNKGGSYQQKIKALAYSISS